MEVREEMKKVMIIGCGDIGRRVARLALGDGCAVRGLVRSEESAEKLRKLGGQPVIANLDDPDTLHDLPVAGSILFYFAPPPGGGNTDPRVANLCAALPAGHAPQKIVYMSTSGVYGDCGGEEVTEESPVNPETARGKRRLDAETRFRAWGTSRGVAVIILRVTGIYGPGRLPVSQLESGQPLLNEDEAGLTNRIHAADLARVCIAAARRGADGDIFNVSDGHPTTMTHYFRAVAALLGYPPPREVPLDEARRVMSPLMLSYMTESRRMDNSRMLSKLGVTLLYPELAAGLQACGSGQE